MALYDVYSKYIMHVPSINLLHMIRPVYYRLYSELQVPLIRDFWNSL